jgi:hypothetical protein
MRKASYISRILIAAALGITLTHALSQPAPENPKKLPILGQQSEENANQKSAQKPEETLAETRNRILQMDEVVTVQEKEGKKPGVQDELEASDSTSKPEVAQETGKDTVKKDSENLKVEVENSASPPQLVESPPQQTKKQSYPATTTERIFVIAVYLIFLSANFALYVLVPKSRAVIIATPLNLGGSTTGAKKWKQNLTEFLLLLIVTWWYFYATLHKEWQDESIPLTLQHGLKDFFIAQAVYLVARLCFAYGTQCPKCKVTYSSELVDSFEQPSSTFRHHSGNMVEVMEVGTKTSSYICVTCKHEWQRSQSYKKRVGRG